MKIKFDLNKSQFDNAEYYGTVTLSYKDDEVKINITVLKGDKGLYVGYPSKKNEKEDKYYNQVFLSENLYKEVNEVLNQEYK